MDTILEAALTLAEKLSEPLNDLTAEVAELRFSIDALRTSVAAIAQSLQMNARRA